MTVALLLGGAALTGATAAAGHVEGGSAPTGHHENAVGAGFHDSATVLLNRDW